MTPNLDEIITRLRRETDFILLVPGRGPMCYTNIPIADTIEILTNLLEALHEATDSTNTNTNTNN
jgi:hypothetical protein